MSKIVNLSTLELNKLPANSIYVEVGSKWANPFVPGKDGTEEECLDLYKIRIATDLDLLEAIDELKDKDLLCYRAPHAELLLELAGMNQGEREHWADQVLGIG